jgi:hypothetical protein
MTLAIASCLGECLLACTKMLASLSSVCVENGRSCVARAVASGAPRSRGVGWC